MRKAGTNRSSLASSRRAPLRRGGAVLETALLMLPVAAILFGAAEYGQAMYMKHTLTGVAREGLRVAILPGNDNADVRDRVNRLMDAAGYEAGEYTIAITNENDAAVEAGTQVSPSAIKVKVAMSFDESAVRVLGNWSPFFGKDLQISGSATGMKE